MKFDKLTKMYNKLPFKVRRFNAVVIAGTAIVLGYVIALPLKIMWSAYKSAVTHCKEHTEVVKDGLEVYKDNFKHDSEFWKL